MGYTEADGGDLGAETEKVGAVWYMGGDITCIGGIKYI